MSKKSVRQIEQKDYERVRPIFAELAEIHLNITAVLDGNCPGKVFVDDIVNPQTAYMRTLCDGHYFAGVQHNHAFNTALNALLPRDTYFVLFRDPYHWESALDVVLENTYAIRARRCYYTLEQLKIVDWRDRISAGFSMQRIEAALLAKGLKNSDDVVEGRPELFWNPSLDQMQEWKKLAERFEGKADL